MNKTPILDDFTEKSRWSASKKTQQIFIIVEIVLWSICLLAFLFKIARAAMSSEILIIGGSLLAFFYLLCPVFIFGSAGWKRHVGVHLIGLALFSTVMASLFVFLHWHDSAAQVKIGLTLSIFATIFTLLFYVVFSKNTGGKRFYRAILLRIAPLMFLMGWLM